MMLGRGHCSYRSGFLPRLPPPIPDGADQPPLPTVFDAAPVQQCPEKPGRFNLTNQGYISHLQLEVKRETLPE